MNIKTAIESLGADVAALVGDSASVLTESTEVRPSLESGQVTIWVPPPTSLAFPTWGSTEATVEIAAISPLDSSPLEALDQLSDVIGALKDDLPITSVDLDTVQLGAGPHWPAALITTSITI